MYLLYNILQQLQIISQPVTYSDTTVSQAINANSIYNLQNIYTIDEIVSPTKQKNIFEIIDDSSQKIQQYISPLSNIDIKSDTEELQKLYIRVSHTISDANFSTKEFENFNNFIIKNMNLNFEDSKEILELLFIIISIAQDNINPEAVNIYKNFTEYQHLILQESITKLLLNKSNTIRKNILYKGAIDSQHKKVANVQSKRAINPQGVDEDVNENNFSQIEPQNNNDLQDDLEDGEIQNLDSFDGGGGSGGSGGGGDNTHKKDDNQNQVIEENINNNLNKPENDTYVVYPLYILPNYPPVYSYLIAFFAFLVFIFLFSLTFHRIVEDDITLTQFLYDMLCSVSFACTAFVSLICKPFILLFKTISKISFITKPLHTSSSSNYISR